MMSSSSGGSKSNSANKTRIKPEWMTKKRERIKSPKPSSSTSSLLERSNSTNSATSIGRTSKSLYLMSQKEFLQIAHQVLETEKEGETS
ncbi:hypothetical protein ElyMa_004752400 [Elysia marginata]|uniref:Uncharacterized protein n=1 Tax=Elysia marginata TaxID=1093978 RepID=A0AAV4IHW8_9GAST|nr:hypothetical protein ElyMa_004752400 [Elysia marginata]